MSKEAKELIKEALKNQAKSLDLSNCDLEELPKEIGALIQLEDLRLSGNQKVSDLSPLANLQNLNTLDVSNT
ncbi:MAG: leucine-rich repeat domain-containing protein [Haliscomenobacter sp.]|uniref:leucine-rich repeat domain-containing protein n=1 Tax=Haliscomenobacter sp. TaxID=2717303 RepID=UPI0029B17348|nr:leucine-rich repeat domain-containing protein [Haliscomenobacter sp.]MDX2067495.1 leucine-rich repeat domain-containing protein [Haliscomenobacter sp.]